MAFITELELEIFSPNYRLREILELHSPYSHLLFYIFAIIYEITVSI